MSAGEDTVQLAMPADLMLYLRKQAAERGVSVGDAIRHAVRTDAYFRTNIDPNTEVFVKKGGKSVAVSLK